MITSNGKSIVVVDDEYDIAKIIKRSLETVCGFKVCTFTDPVAALEHFSSDSKDHHHAVISDIRMPGMNGYEFIKQVKKINPKVKVILISSFGIEDKEFYNVLSDIKVDGFLQKPFSTRQLNDVIEKIGTIKD